MIPAFFLFFTTNGQDGINLDEISSDIEKSNVGIMEMFSFTISAGSGSLNNSNFSNVTLGELNISYKHTDRISFGFATMGDLSGCPIGYTNSEGNYVTYDNDNDDADDVDDDEIEGEDDGEDCDADELSNIMATATYHLSDKVPVFIEAAAGYSFASNAPAISAYVGYNQKIITKLGILGGVRFSNVFIQKPADAVQFSSFNIRLEVGATWNF